jgi:hypothetical protein
MVAVDIRQANLVRTLAGQLSLPENDERISNVTNSRAFREFLDAPDVLTLCVADDGKVGLHRFRFGSEL